MDNQKLSARVEALEGPDRKVDGDIARKIYGAGGDGLEGTTLYSKPGVMGWTGRGQCPVNPPYHRQRHFKAKGL
ncbi:MAG: hypothetical protein IPM41_16135 [Sphingomonadales bacterium]|nr:hypothetical protein [Sphingomonadales bacterium]